MTQQYEQVAGTKPDIDEQHEARTIRRTTSDRGVLMMTEIGDGTFVEWSTCSKCQNRVDECNHPGGPVEPDWLSKARSNRFINSFAVRDAKPPLPESLKQRDRTVNAVMQLLLEKGFTITSPATKVTEDDIEFARDTLGEDASEEDTLALAAERVDRDAAEVAENVANGIDSALERVRARAEEDNSDIGF